MWALICSGIPIGVTPAGLQRCIEDALDQRTEFPQRPIIVNHEALVYVSTRDVQIKLASTQVRCHSSILNIEKINKDHAQQWVLRHRYIPPHKRGAQQSQINILPHAATRHRSPPPPADVYQQQNRSTGRSGSLFGQLPVFSREDANAIIWYQYLIFVGAPKTPFYVTYPAEWCWDIEGQWVKFQEHYAINPVEAQKVDSRFSIGESDRRGNHWMIGDVFNMKVTDKNTGHEYEFKRTDRLVGILIDYGQIAFNRYYSRDRDKTEIFVYDRRTAYHSSNDEDDFKIGDRVVFEAWWNKDDSDCYHYDISNVDLNISSKYADASLHFDMFAFNVKLGTSADVMMMTGSNKSAYRFRYNTQRFEQLPLNPFMESARNSSSYSLHSQSLARCDPAIADAFKGERYGGLLISLHEDHTGLTVCYPWKQQPERPLTLIFHTRFVHAADRKKGLTANTFVEFSIGVNPNTNGLFRYVAIDIVASDQNTSDVANNRIPITIARIAREFRGRVVVPPLHSNGMSGWIYNEFDHTMSFLQLPLHYNKPADADKEMGKYACGTFLRYNEHKVSAEVDGGSVRDAYTISATDVVTVDRVQPEQLSEYYTSNHFVQYTAVHYIAGQRLRMTERTMRQIIQVERVSLADIDNELSVKTTDVCVLVEQIEIHLNAFWNTYGGVVLFGITPDGRIAGQAGMTAAKRHYLEYAVLHRVEHFTPQLDNMSNFYSIEFKPVIDDDGYAIVDNVVIIVDCTKIRMRSHQSHQNKIHFATSQGDVYENRVVTQGNQTRYHVIRVDVRNKQDMKQLQRHESILDRFDNQYGKEGNKRIDEAEEEESSEGGDEAASDEDCTVQNQTVHWTTPALNAMPIPPNTESGQRELSKRVQLKLNEMMMVTEYMMDSRWQAILNMASSPLYNAQKTTWMLMKNLESEKIRHNLSKNKQKQRDLAAKKQRDKQLLQQHHDVKQAPQAAYVVDLHDQDNLQEINKQMIDQQLDEIAAEAPGQYEEQGSDISDLEDDTEEHTTEYHKPDPGIGGKHPKTIILEWTQKKRIAPPKTEFSEFIDPVRNARAWSAKVSFQGETFESKATKKKNAESKCFQELLQHIMGGAVQT